MPRLKQVFIVLGEMNNVVKSERPILGDEPSSQVIFTEQKVPGNKTILTTTLKIEFKIYSLRQ